MTAPANAARGEPAAAAAAAAPPLALRWVLPVAVLLATLAAAALALAWATQQRVLALEAELGRRQQESAQSAGEARALSRQAETAAREAAAKVTLLEERLAQTAMQRSQVEDLLQSLARSRDENVLADVEAAVRVAQQQSAITGSAEPLIAVLRQADERLARFNQPRLERVRRAVAQDLERTRAAGVTDIPVLTIRLDELVRAVDDLPLLSVPAHAAATRRSGRLAGEAGVVTAPVAAAPPPQGAGDWAQTLQQGWARLQAHVWAETRSLLRVTRIDDPEAMLIAPEQAYFLRENLKLRLLNARLALLSRQFDIAQSDLREALAALERYFDRSTRRTTAATEALRQVMAQARTVAVPRPDATLAAIATAAAGR